MKKLALEHQGVLYRNPRPGLRAEYAFVATVLPLSDQEILCFYRIGQAFYSADGKLAQLRSTDGGKTWQQDGAIWDPAHDEQGYSYTAPHGTLLRDGRLLISAFRLDINKYEEGLFNPETGGLRPTEQLLFESTDGGRSWSSPHVMLLPGDGVINPPAPIIELDSGRLFLACEQWKAWDDTNSLHIKGFGMFSDDGGRTWKDRVDFPSAADNVKMYSHTRYCKTIDGRIIGLQWVQDLQDLNKDYDLHLVVGDETATQWSMPQPTGVAAQTSWAAHVEGDTLAAVYSRRAGDQPGILVALSHDFGKSWNLENQVLVWDAVGQEYLGAQLPPSSLIRHENIAFGKPNLVRLPNGTLMCAWWCTQASITHIRYAKLRVVDV